MWAVRSEDDGDLLWLKTVLKNQTPKLVVLETGISFIIAEIRRQN